MKTISKKQLKGIQKRDGFECTLIADYESTEFRGAPEWFTEKLFCVGEGCKVRIKFIEDYPVVTERKPKAEK